VYRVNMVCFRYIIVNVVYKINNYLFSSMSVHSVILSPTTDRLCNKIFSDRQTDSLKMGTSSGPETLGKFHPLDTVICPNFIEFCRRESFKTDRLLSITIESYRLVTNVRLRTFNVMKWCEIRRNSLFLPDD
jgi:hypothetical protein